MLKKEYVEPEFLLVKLTMESVLNGEVIHTSFEQGGKNTGWDFGEDDDDDNFGGLR